MIDRGVAAGCPQVLSLDLFRESHLQGVESCRSVNLHRALSQICPIGLHAEVATSASDVTERIVRSTVSARILQKDTEIAAASPRIESHSTRADRFRRAARGRQAERPRRRCQN
jgi:hypothetical protein